jgi:tetratricopeptide (TPR) repeat protein
LVAAVARNQKLGLVAALIGIGLGFGSLAWMLFDWTCGSGYHERAARHALEHRDFVDAAHHLDLYLKAHPTSPEGHLLAARVARRRIEPVLPGAMDDVGRSAAGSSGSAESADQFRHHLAECRRQGGALKVVRFEEVLFQAQNGRLAAVEDDLQRRVAQDDPDALAILEALIKGYLLTYRLPDAEACLNLWLERKPEAQAHVWRGWVRERLADTGQAIADYRKAVELDPDNLRARLWLAEALTAAAQPREAAAQYEILLERHPENVAVAVGLARCCRDLDDMAKARLLLDDCLAANPDHVPALLERGKLALLSADSPSRAVAWLRRAADRAPHNYQVLFSLAQALQRAGQTEEARSCRERSQKIAADLQRLNELTHEIGADPKAVDLRFEAGSILLRNGYERDGLRWLDSVLQQDPGHALTHQALAAYYKNKGQPTPEPRPITAVR